MPLPGTTVSNVAGDDFTKDGFPKKLFNTTVCFAYTTRGNDIYYRLVTYLLQQKHAFENMCVVSAVNSWRPSLEVLFRMAHDTGSAFVQIMDSDVAPRQDTTAKLMQHDLDIVTCPIWFYDSGNHSLHLNIHYTPECLKEFTPKPPDTGVERIFSTSFGCCLIKRRVIETFLQMGESFCEWSGFLEERYKHASPDTIFFAKCAQMGFDAHVDWSCEFATHHKYVALNAQTVEVFTAHRIFDREYGPERKRELLASEQGQDELRSFLSSGKPLVTARSGPE